jgi:hypothetical protein
MAANDPTSQEVDWSNYAKATVSAFAEAYPLDAVKDALTNAVAKGIHAAYSALIEAAESIARKGGELLPKLEEPVGDIVGAFVAPVIASMFDTQVDPEVFQRLGANGGRESAARDIVDAYFSAIAGDTDGPIEPGDEGAKRIASAGVHAAIEGWFNAFLVENLADFFPEDWMHIHGLDRLPEEVLGALGLSRLVRRAISPLVNAVAAEPMRTASNYRYRPTKLSPSLVAKLYQSGQLDYDTAITVLAYEGYRDEYADFILKDAQKFLTLDDLAFLVWEGIIEQDEALQTMQRMGYDDQTASKHLNAQQIKRQDALRRTLADAAVTAYVDRRIDDTTLNDVLSPTIQSNFELKELLTIATGKRALNIKTLSASQADACVKAGIVPMSEYRAALAREGYTDDAIDALEMLLRKQIDDKANADDLRRQQQEERKAEAEKRKQEQEQRRKELEEKRKAGKPGSVAAFADAVVRGLLPIAQFETWLRKQFDAESVGVYVADVEARRADYVERQKKANDKEKLLKEKGLSVGELRTALVDGVLTADQVRQRLADADLPADDVDVLLATMLDAKQQHDDAVKARDEAKKKSKGARLTLAQAEALVLAGHWTRPQFDAWLRAMGFSDADVANIDTLVDDKIHKHQAAAGIRTATAAAAPSKALTLDQERRAVVLGIKSTNDYAAYLTAAGYSADDVQTLVAEVTDAVDAALAAQQRRAATDAAGDGRSVALSDLARAARLGILTVDQYSSALLARGYNADDVALELDLLAAEIAQSGGTQRTVSGAASGASSGASTPAAAAAARHVTIDGELAARSISLAEAEQGVEKGMVTLDAFVTWLTNNGYGGADAELLRALLSVKLAKQGG